MKTSTFGYALSIGAAAAVLAGCGSSPRIGVGGAMPQSRGIAAHGTNESWMRPEAKNKSILMYAGGVYGNVYVYDYFTGKQVGTLNGISGNFGMCVDAIGDVYVGQSNMTTLEYAHGGTKVLNTYTTRTISDGCSVDAKNDVAISSESSSSPGVTVFVGGDPSKGQTYSNKECKNTPPMGYDTQGKIVSQAVVYERAALVA